VVNFTDDDPFDAKAVWLNAEHIRALPVEELSRDLEPFFFAAGFKPKHGKLEAVTPLIRERIKLLRDAVPPPIFSSSTNFLRTTRGVDSAKRRCRAGQRVLQTALEVLPVTAFDHDSLDKALRTAADQLGLKAGQAFQPIRVAVCGRKNAPPLFETMVVLGREVCLERIREAEKNLQSLV
jgi:glutamyl-tRNA synthetase